MSPPVDARSRWSSASLRATVSRRARSRELVSDLASPASRLGGRAAAFAEMRFGLLLLAPQSFDFPAKPLDFLLCLGSFLARLFGGLVSFCPARVDEPRLDRSDLVGQLAVAFGRPRLPAKRGGPLFLVA
jgi:hypothetical protein